MEKKIRLIARLDVKGQNVVKGVHLEGLRIVGKPDNLARKYYEEGIDELIYIDSVASLYGRNSLKNVVKQMAREIYVPVTVGGGIRTLDDIQELLRAGADKVAINTEATKRPDFITEAAHKFGSQCIVLSIAAKKTGQKKWEAFTDNGRERTGIDVIEWARRGDELGAGEIFLTSIDQEGTYEGFDLELYQEVCDKITIPVIGSGGAGSHDDIIACLRGSSVSAVALASILHYNDTSVSTIRKVLLENNISIRDCVSSKDGHSATKQKHAEATRPHLSQKKNVSILDYGVGNIYSIIKSLEELDITSKVITTPEEVLDAEHLVLPGVGAFKTAMEILSASGLKESIKEYAKRGNPLLGICLGAQLIMSDSEEFEPTQGLDLIKGSIVSLKREKQLTDEKYRIPHIGWGELVESHVNHNELTNYLSRHRQITFNINWRNTLLENVSIGSQVYFVHSYKIVPVDEQKMISVCFYGTSKICAVIQDANIMGCQFHPEKSGVVGLAVLKKFSQL